MTNDTAAGYESSDKRDCACKTSQHGTPELYTSSEQSPLIFDPLGNGSPVLYIDNQKVSQLDKCQEAGSEGGLGMSFQTATFT